jgi:glycosyltransferase involved in cell wall biosynthesis
VSIEFSVIIPTHNRQEMLSRAIASVAIEAQGAVEVIVVDDGSRS